jgi:5-methylthioadenosine/S-adenosylhomocysteine deaminase
MSIELLCPQWVVPVEPQSVVLADHTVAIENGLIVAIIPTEEALQRWPDAIRTPLPGHLLIPGLVNAHSHAAMSLLRGVADDLPLEKWLHDRIWPLEGRLLSPEFVYDGAVLAANEMLLGGITCFNDMYFFPEHTARAAHALGMRAMVGIVVFEFASAYGTGPDDYLRKGLRLRDQLRGDPRVGFTLAPHSPYAVSDESFRRIAVLAAELGLPVHCHLHETAFEVETSVREHGKRPIERLDQLGMLGPEFIAVHAVHLNDRDIDLLARHGASVAHCPHSNLKLGCGIAPTSRLIERGINVGIGTDGSASNNRLDLIEEARTASLLAKGSTGNASAWPAHQTLRAMTLAGARSIGMGETIGSIEPGKAADLVAIDLSSLQLSPVFDPVSQFIYAADRSAVTDVWIGGVAVVHKRQLCDTGAASAVAEVAAKCRLWHNRIDEILLAGRGG